MEDVLVAALVLAIPIIAIVMNYWHKVKKMEHERVTMQHQMAMLNPQAAANLTASNEALKRIDALSNQLADTTHQLARMNARLQNLESIVTSPGFVATQIQTADFQSLNDEQQAAELAKQIAAREGRIS